ncbi:MAG: LPS export ABC transporter periplasmic protein LptC, partial [Spirochaetota bacterium]
MKVAVPFLAIVLLCVSCKKPQVPRIEDEEEFGSTITFRNFIRRAFNSDGVLQWELDAQKAYVFIKENKTIVYELELKQYENGAYKSTITAKKGVMDHSIKKVHLQGNIVVISVEKRTLKAEELFYDLEEEKLVSDGEVAILSEGLTIHGKGFRADKNLKKYTIIKPTGITKGNPLKEK